MSDPDRSIGVREARRVVLVIAALCALLAWPALGWAATGTDTAAPVSSTPLVLTNAQVGMTRAEIEASQPRQPAVPAPSGRTESPSDLEARARSLEEIASAAHQRAREAADRAEALQRAVEAAEAGLIPGVGPSRDGPATLARCMEASIRRGESFANADRLCRVVFHDIAR
jgi:hypothetical protein